MCQALWPRRGFHFLLVAVLRERYRCCHCREQGNKHWAMKLEPVRELQHSDTPPAFAVCDWGGTAIRSSASTSPTSTPDKGVEGSGGDGGPTERSPSSTHRGKSGILSAGRSSVPLPRSCPHCVMNLKVTLWSPLMKGKKWQMVYVAHWWGGGGGLQRCGPWLTRTFSNQARRFCRRQCVLHDS